MKAIYLMIAVFLSISTVSFAMSDSERFKILDANNDGVLTKEEVKSKPKLIHYTNLYPRGGFETADFNNDNVIDYEEYMANEEDIY